MVISVSNDACQPVMMLLSISLASTSEKVDHASFYRVTACNATQGTVVAILSVCLSVRLSVCLSVRRVYCDKTKLWTADVLIPHETAITLVFWHRRLLVGDAPFPLKSALKVTHPIRKTPNSTDFRL